MPNDALPDDLQTLKAMLLAERCESERLRQIIKELQRHRFGSRAETLPEEQMLLGLEEVEQVEASGEAKQDENAPDGRAVRAGKRRGNRGALPAHLPRIEIVVDIDDKTCPCCQGELHRIGEDKSERLGACPNSRCSILSESDSSLSYEQVFSPLEYRSDTAAAAECAGLRAERPCLAVYVELVGGRLD